MVVFTCGHCGESVQKPKVEKHYLTKCRNRNPNLSCMDCFKDFLGNDYEAHIKCITEEQRYSGKGFVAKEKKGELKQNAWVEMLQNVLEEQRNAPSNVLRIIETISKHNNTPRKKPKFINFIKNVCGQKTNPKDIDQAWDLISVKLSALSNSNNNKSNENNHTNNKFDKKQVTDDIEKNKNEQNENQSENGNTDLQNGDIEKQGDKKLMKKQQEQNDWVEILQNILKEQKNASSNVLKIIETISKHNNIPRKKPKFINFIKTVCEQKADPNDIDEAWNLISVKLSALSNANYDRPNENKNTNNKTDEIQLNDDVQKSNNEQNENGLENGNTELQTGNTENGDVKKLSKKQRKEEKKRKKYEAELQSAMEPLVEVEQENETIKKDKKKKNKAIDTPLTNGDTEQAQQTNGKTKDKKRKRQDTINGTHDVQDNSTDNIENEPVNKEKNQKKKRKLENQDEDENLHDKNVAKGEEIGDSTVKKDKFNWHTVILSVLEKKGNELPFKRLQKKVLTEYTEITGREVDDRIADKFIKKLKSAPNVRVDKDRVMLLQ